MDKENGTVEVNRATADELATIPGIGPTLAERIVAARPFTSVDELTRVSGIGPVSLQRLKPYIRIETSSAADQVEEAAFSPAQAGPALTESAKPEEIESIPAESHVTESPKAEVETSPAESKAAQSGQSAVSEPVSPVQPAPVPSASATAKPVKGGEKYARREDLIWTGVGVAILTLILSLIFSLGSLFLINQTLTYAPAAEVQALSARLDALNNRIRLLEGDVDNLRSRVQTIEALGGRVTSLERGQQSLSEELKTAQSTLGELQQQSAALQNQIEELQKRSNVFQNFLDGLRRLLSVGETP